MDIWIQLYVLPVVLFDEQVFPFSAAFAASSGLYSGCLDKGRAGGDEGKSGMGYGFLLVRFMDMSFYFTFKLMFTENWINFFELISLSESKLQSYLLIVVLQNWMKR